jgi:outer membrane cobalamin receptor
VKRTTFVGCAGVALVCAFVREARADGAGDLQGLLSESFVSGASKSTESGATAPAVTTTLSSEDIKRYGIHSLDEAVNFLSLGAVTSNSPGAVEIGADGVLITGDKGNHFLLLIDGHQVNEALFGEAQFGRGAGIPMEMVDHIEVILGPGSVLYGSSAMLGVINVVTKEERAFSGTHVAVESEVPTSVRAAVGGGYELQLLGQPAKLAYELEYYGQDGPALALAPQRYGTNGFTNTPFNFGGAQATGVWGGTADQSSQIPSGLLTFRLGDFELDVHGSMDRRRTPFNADFIVPEANFNDPNNEEVDRSGSVDLKHRLVLSSVTELRSRLYADAFEARRTADSSAAGPDTCAFNVATCQHVAFGASRWLGAEEQTLFDWRKDASLVTLLGVDGRVRSISAQQDVLDASNGRPLASSTGVLRATDEVFAAYAQQIWKPTTWLGFDAGGRFDYDERFGSHVSPRVAGTVEAWRGGTLKAIYSEAFRAPSWEESSVSFGEQIPAGQLRPETVRSIELAVDQEISAHRLRIGLFRSWWTDMVELHELTPTEIAQAQMARLLNLSAQYATQYQNVSSIDDVGFNAGYEGSFATTRLKYALNVTGAMARRSEEGGAALPLVVSPQVFGNARLAYELPGDLPTIALAGHYLGTRPVNRAYGAGFVPTPYAPPLGELRATLSGPVPPIHGLSYRASANYVLTDRGAYVIGPFQNGEAVALPTDPRTYPTSPALNPIDRFRASVAVFYDF